MDNTEKVIIIAFFNDRGGISLPGTPDLYSPAVQRVWQYLYYSILEIAEKEAEDVEEGEKD